jgi:CheY-like chemotaxis protein
VVDDVPSNLIVAKGILEIFDITVYVANNGQKAIDMIREEKIGSEYAKTVPIIALTAYDSHKNMFLQNGFQDYLPKPIDIAELENILLKWVAHC